MVNSYISDIRFYVKQYLKEQERVAQAKKEIIDKYSNYIDKSGLEEELAEIDSELKQIQRETIDNISKLIKAYRNEVKRWGLPTAEKMKDIQVLELDLTEDDLCYLIEEHRDNPIMLKAIRNYALKNDMRKVLSMDYKLPEDKLKTIDYVESVIIRGIRDGGYWGALISDEEAFERFINNTIGE